MVRHGASDGLCAMLLAETMSKCDSWRGIDRQRGDWALWAEANDAVRRRGALNDVVTRRPVPSVYRTVP